MAGIPWTSQEVKILKEHGGKWIPSGPGYREHCVSEGIEKILAAISAVNWDTYEAEVANTPAEPA